MAVKFGFHPAPWLIGEPRRTLEDALGAIKRAGWVGVELCNTQAAFYPDSVDDIGTMLREHGLELTTFYHGQRLDVSFDMRNALAEAARHIEINHALGASVFAVNAGTGGRDDERHIDRLVEYACRVGETARKRGMALSWHQHYGSTLDRPAAFERFMERTDPNLVGFCPDMAQLAMSGLDPVATCRRYLDRINYAHFKDIEFLAEDGTPEPRLRPGGSRRGYARTGRRDCRVREPGQGVIDFPALWGMLRERGYDGWIVVDLDYTLTTPEDSSACSLACLRRLIHP